jgi:hypothetical protein
MLIANEDRKVFNTIKSKKKIGKPKYCAFPKVQDDCNKESVQSTYSLHIQELRDIVRGTTSNK